MNVVEIKLKNGRFEPVVHHQLKKNYTLISTMFIKTLLITKDVDNVVEGGGGGGGCTHRGTHFMTVYSYSSDLAPPSATSPPSCCCGSCCCFLE